MHRAAFAAAGLAGTYEARRVTSAELPVAVAELRQPDILGANLSLPHKEAVLPLLDSLTDAAKQIGAVNTVIRQGERLIGDNTDASGFVAALQDAGMWSPTLAGRPAVVLGAGGAARAAVYALQVALQVPVLIVNRTPAKALALAQDFGASALLREDVPWAEVGLIVNSSSAGLSNPAETPLPDFDWASAPNAAVYDMVYKPAETRLMREARAAGRPAENGLGMLAHQARLAFAAWTGRQVPVQVFLGALAEATR